MKPVVFLLVCTLLTGLLAACQSITAPSSGVPIPAVTMELTDKGITTPAEMPAGVVSVTVKNNGAAADEGQCGSVVTLVRLAEGKTAEDFMTALEVGPLDPAVATVLGGVCVAAGQSGQAIYNLEPGSYLAVGSTQEVTIAEISVKPGNNQAVVPKAEVKVDLLDFSFALPDTIKAGPQLWEISNKGKQWHHMSIIRLDEGATIDQVVEMVMAEEPPSGSPPAKELALWEFMSPGVTAWATLDLPPGEYQVVCFLPDFTSDPPMPHVSHGMVRTLKVIE